MALKFYIITEENEKRFITPEPCELKDAKNAIKWGLTNGIVSLVKPIRTSTTYWILEN